MRLNELNDRPGSRKTRKRVGRGMGSGKGKTSGSGHKGQKSRSGVSLLGFEGGQMPLYRRLPKRGFKNPFSKDIAELTTGSLENAVAKGKIDGQKPVTETVLVEAGVVKKNKDGVRLIARGDLMAKLTLEITGASKGAIAAVEKAGGKVNLLPQKPKPEGKGKARHRKFKEGASEKPKKKTDQAPEELEAKEESGKEEPVEREEKTEPSDNGKTDSDQG